MGRPLRLDPDHGIHHVYSRGTRRWTLFIDNTDYQRFMQRLAIVCLRYDVRLYAYCLMGNHFHLVAYCPKAQLSAAVRDLKSVYARTHNDRHGFSGPLFEARFGSKLVESYDYLQVLIRYVHRNVLAINSKAPLDAYPYSSHHLYLGDPRHVPDWCDPTFPLSFFADRDQYRAYVEANVETDEIHATPSDIEPQRAVQAQPEAYSIASLLLHVAAVAECDPVDVRPKARNGLVGLLALIASEFGAYTAPELVDACGFSSPNAIYNLKLQTRRRIASDETFRNIYDAVVARLSKPGAC